jgi:hypothetical protein
MDGTGIIDGIEQRGLDREALKRAIVEKLAYAIGKDPSHATDRDWFAAVALAVRERMVDRWMETTRAYHERDQKRVYYLSLEFLIGRLLRDGLGNLGMLEACRGALEELGVDGMLTLFSMTKIWSEAFWKPLRPDQDTTLLETEGIPGRAGVRVMMIPIILLATMTLIIGLWAGPFYDVSLVAAEELLDPSNYIQAVLGR